MSNHDAFERFAEREELLIEEALDNGDHPPPPDAPLPQTP